MYKSIADVDEVLKASFGKRILIFKHSSACPLSARGKSEVDGFLKNNGEVEAYLVVIQDQRPVSNELAQKLGVIHESPQLLVIRDGKAEKVLNHYMIRSGEIARLMAE